MRRLWTWLTTTSPAAAEAMDRVAEHRVGQSQTLAVLAFTRDLQRAFDAAVEASERISREVHGAFIRMDFRSDPE